MKLEIIAERVVIHQYRYFYYLANELAFMSVNNKYEMNASRYAIGTIIMSYTTIETYFNHLLFSDEYPLHRIHEGMSDELLRKIERMSLPEKIEFALRFYPEARPELLKIDQEPYQSFDLLRQMRNLLIHYMPKERLIWSKTGEHIDKVDKLEKQLTGRFSFLPINQVMQGEPKKEFLFRVFNGSCAKWAFELVAPFTSTLAEAFQIPYFPFEVYWELTKEGDNALKPACSDIRGEASDAGQELKNS